MNAGAIFELAVTTLAQYGLLDQGWRIEWDNGKRRAGACHYHRRVISLSKHIMATAPDEEVRETILHEIAHALTPTDQAHGAVWRAKLIEMGGTGARTHSMETVKGRYDMICTTCGVVGDRHAAQGSWKRASATNGIYRHRKCTTGNLYLVDRQSGQPVARQPHAPVHTITTDTILAGIAAATPTRKPAPKPTTGKVCMCGCGESVTNNYRPGHDARHVSALAQAVFGKTLHIDEALRTLPTDALRNKLMNRIDK